MTIVPDRSRPGEATHNYLVADGRSSPLLTCPKLKDIDLYRSSTYDVPRAATKRHIATRDRQV